MQWKDSDSGGSRLAFSAVHGSYRLRRWLREWRNISGTTLVAVVFLVLGLAIRNWLLFAAFLLMLAVNTAQWI